MKQFFSVAMLFGVMCFVAWVFMTGAKADTPTPAPGCGFVSALPWSPCATTPPIAGQGNWTPIDGIPGTLGPHGYTPITGR